MSNSVHEKFGKKLRVRVCGICCRTEGILLVNHKISGTDFWAPPGGGLEFGESVEDCLKREFLEETGLQIEVKELTIVNEFLKPPLHAIELFFRVFETGGVLKKGFDPEMGDSQIISEAQFFPWEDIKRMKPEHLHGIFKKVKNPEDFRAWNGHFKLQ